MERPGGISFQSHSGKAATERREGSWRSLGGQEFGKKEKKGRAWGAVVIVWNFKEERFGRILKKVLPCVVLGNQSLCSVLQRALVTKLFVSCQCFLQLDRFLLGEKGAKKDELSPGSRAFCLLCLL